MFDPLEQLGAGRALRIVQRLKALPHELLRQAFFFFNVERFWSRGESGTVGDVRHGESPQ